MESPSHGGAGMIGKHDLQTRVRPAATCAGPTRPLCDTTPSARSAKRRCRGLDGGKERLRRCVRGDAGGTLPGPLSSTVTVHAPRVIGHRFDDDVWHDVRARTRFKRYAEVAERPAATAIPSPDLS